MARIEESITFVGSAAWYDHNTIRDRIRVLPEGTRILLDDEPFQIEVAAARQARCSGLVAVVYCLPSNSGKGAVAARAVRDRVMFADSHRVLVFGELPEDREATLQALLMGRQLPVERIR